MQAVVVYESMFGNTHAIADAVAAGLAETFDVEVVPVTRADLAQIGEADLVVVGGPTHVHGMSRASTRASAAKQAEADGSGLTLEPDAVNEGVREWLTSLNSGRGHGMAAAFDTRLRGPVAFTGHASKSIGRALRRTGYELIAEPESFLITGKNKLCAGELERARVWGAALTSTLSLAG